MRRARLYHGARCFELGVAGAARGRWTVASRADAVAVLRRIASEPSQRAFLRRWLAEAAPASGGAIASDDAILRSCEALLESGHLVLTELARIDSIPVGIGEQEEVAADAPLERRAPRTWIEIQMVGEDGKPIAGERYRIVLPDGSTRDGRLDAEGLARVDGIDPGTCDVTFPALDEEAWQRI